MSISQIVQNYKHWLIAIVCLLPLFLYIDKTNHHEKTILVLGDSLSTPYGIGKKDCWVYLLQQRLNTYNRNYHVVDSSVPGDTTEDGLDRLPRKLHDEKPILTIIELGANDAIKGIPLETTKQNLLQMIKLVKQSKSKVLLLGMRMPDIATTGNAKDFQQMYFDLAKQENIPFVPFFLRNVESNPELMQDDKLHPVKEAEPILLDNVWPEVKKILGIK